MPIYCFTFQKCVLYSSYVIDCYREVILPFMTSQTVVKFNEIAVVNSKRKNKDIFYTKGENKLQAS